MEVLVIDAQGGGIGREIIIALKKRDPGIRVIAVGANSVATSAMLRAGADSAATGENSVVVASRRADVITGPVGIAIADSLMGEITPKMAKAVGRSRAKRVLIPFNNCNNYIVGLANANIAGLVNQAADKILELADSVPAKEN